VNLTKSQEQKLRHALGAEPGRYPKKQWGFRNHYAIGKTPCSDLDDLIALEKAGLVYRGIETETLIFFHATEAGCLAVGMGKQQIKNALGE